MVCTPFIFSISTLRRPRRHLPTKLRSTSKCLAEKKLHFTTIQQTCHDRGLPQFDGPTVRETKTGELFTQNVPNFACFSQSFTEISRGVSILRQPSCPPFQWRCPIPCSHLEELLPQDSWGSTLDFLLVQFSQSRRAPTTQVLPLVRVNCGAPLFHVLCQGRSAACCHTLSVQHVRVIGEAQEVQLNLLPH